MLTVAFLMTSSHSDRQQTGRGFHIDPPTTPPQDLPISTEGGWKVENALELLDVAEEWYELLRVPPSISAAIHKCRHL